MVKILVDSVVDGHKLHLRALMRQERGVDYQRQDYLSPEWQRSLLRPRSDETFVATAERRSIPSNSSTLSSQQQQRESPTSATSSTSSPSFDFDTSVASSLELCIHWRARIIEWKYQVVDRYGTSPHHEGKYPPLGPFTLLFYGPRMLVSPLFACSSLRSILPLSLQTRGNRPQP